MTDILRTRPVETRIQGHAASSSADLTRPSIILHSLAANSKDRVHVVVTHVRTLSCLILWVHTEGKFWIGCGGRNKTVSNKLLIPFTLCFTSNHAHPQIEYSPDKRTHGNPTNHHGSHNSRCHESGLFHATDAFQKGSIESATTDAITAAVQVSSGPKWRRFIPNADHGVNKSISKHTTSLYNNQTPRVFVLLLLLLVAVPMRTFVDFVPQSTQSAVATRSLFARKEPFTFGLVRVRDGQ